MTRKHVMSQSYNDPNSLHNSVSELERERRRKAAREYYARVKELAPNVPHRPWTVEEMRFVYLSNGTLLQCAIYLNRNYNDVTKTSQELTKLHTEQPDVLAAYLGLTEIQYRVRRLNDESAKFLVCEECFTRPHQISCSHAD